MKESLNEGIASLLMGTRQVTTVNYSCVGCVEVAHAAALCPSFYRAEVTRNPSGLTRMSDRVRRTIISRLQRRSAGAPS